MRWRCRRWGRERREDELWNVVSAGMHETSDGRTRGGERYSAPMLRGCREALRISLTRLYRSTRKLNVGPAGRRTSRRDGATGVNVKASRCETLSAGARVR